MIRSSALQNLLRSSSRVTDKRLKQNRQVIVGHPLSQSLSVGAGSLPFLSPHAALRLPPAEPGKRARV